MRPGRLSRVCLAIIDRYQHSHGAQIYDKRCRFEPSCSAFMQEAFRTRSFVAAFLLSASRLLRCNPFTRQGSKDPVHRAHRRPRPNGVRSIFAVAMLAGIVVVIVASTAGAAITGGCTAFVRGRDITTMTKSNPLNVRTGEELAVNGTHPAPASPTLTVVAIDIVKPILDFSGTEAQNGTGTTWSGSANVDQYLTKGSGLYEVRAQTHWGDNQSCISTFYVDFSGGRTIELAAGGVALVGGVGAGASAGRKKSGVTLDDLGKGLDDDIKRDIPGIDPPTQPKITVAPARGGGTYCCAVPILLAPVSAVVAMAGFGAGAPADGGGEVLYSKLKWKRGHPVLGFIFGLLLGVGVTVVLQQESVWTLDIWTGIVLPVGIAILAAMRARIGRPYRVTVTR